MCIMCQGSTSLSNVVQDCQGCNCFNVRLNVLKAQKKHFRIPVFYLISISMTRDPSFQVYKDIQTISGVITNKSAVSLWVLWFR